MKGLIVDANVPLSILISPYGKTGQLFSKLSLNLIAPIELIEEVEAKWSKAERWTNVKPVEDLSLIWESMLRTIKISPSAGYLYQLSAKKILSSVDPKDEPYLALAQEQQYPLWTGDKRLAIAVKGIHPCYSTAELAAALGLT